MDRQTDRQNERWTERQTDRQTQTDGVRHVTWPPTGDSYTTNKKADRQTDGLRDRQTDKMQIQNASSYRDGHITNRLIKKQKLP